MNIAYAISYDIESFLAASGLTLSELAEGACISRPTLDAIIRKNEASPSMLERVYSYVYRKGFRLNRAKCELMQESILPPHVLLFHGAKETLGEVSPQGSREDCDFGKGFYLGEHYSSAVDFVAHKPASTVYAFRLNPDGLRIKEFGCDLPWMLSICAHRGYLRQYESHPKLRALMGEEAAQDVIIAPIADNKMFQILREFGMGEISASMAMHALSASSLGKQYVIKTPKALANLQMLDCLYLSDPEREDQQKNSAERALLIDSKLKLAKRTYRDARDFIEEIFEDGINEAAA